MGLIQPFPAALCPEARGLLEDFIKLTDRLFPLPGRFRAGLGRDAAGLSRLLTSERGSLPEGYLGRPSLLSAYLRYFLPWNLYRLARLLPALPLALSQGDAVTDLGSGPLTLPLALWIARPDLRSLELEFRCLDRTEAALKAGKRLFAALAGPKSPWKLKTIHASLDAKVNGKPAALAAAVNVYNEVFRALPHTDSRSLEKAAAVEARRLAALSSGEVLVVEPGVPRSGEFIACLRAALLELGLSPLSPCTHSSPCPYPGGRDAGTKRKWCHFAFEARDAPGALMEISAAAGLPKERAVLSFILAGRADRGASSAAGDGSGEKPVRILSDPFPLPGGRPGERYGRYGCSEWGAALAAGEKRKIYALNSGSLLQAAMPAPGLRGRPGLRDSKTGAALVEVPY
jgi:hypothetical protein